MRVLHLGLQGRVLRKMCDIELGIEVLEEQDKSIGDQIALRTRVINGISVIRAI